MIYRLAEEASEARSRQRHFAGETLFVDHAGRIVPIYGRSGVSIEEGNSAV